MTAGSDLVDAYIRPVKSIEGKVVLCEGGWNDPRNSEQLQSAISALHQQFGMQPRQCAVVFFQNFTNVIRT